MERHELYKLIEGPEGATGPYPWMVWEIGPMKDHFFETEDQARGFISEAEENDDDAS